MYFRMVRWPKTVKYYAFNNSGECLNTSGQSSQYNNDDYYYMTGSIKLNNVFYINDTEPGNSPDYSYVEYAGGWNGWIADGSEWYYYENGVKVSGWKQTSDGC